jgi:hypothetical protein
MEAWDKACNQSEEFDFGDEVVSKDHMQEISMNDQELKDSAGGISVKAEFLKLYPRLGHLAFSKMKIIKK